jgi:hypothetical protein
MENETKPPARWTMRRVGLVLLAVLWLVGIAMIFIGNYKIKSARGEAGYARNTQAFAMVAALAGDKITPVSGNLNLGNTGAAEAKIADVSEFVDLLQVLAPPEQQDQARQVKDKIDQAKGLIATDTKGANDRLKQASDILDSMSGKPQEK